MLAVAEMLLPAVMFFMLVLSCQGRSARDLWKDWSCWKTLFCGCLFSFSSYETKNNFEHWANDFKLVSLDIVKAFK